VFEKDCHSALDVTKAKKLQLRNDTVTGRAECMSSDLCKQLLSKSAYFVCCCVAHDGTKDVAVRE